MPSISIDRRAVSNLLLIVIVSGRGIARMAVRRIQMLMLHDVVRCRVQGATVSENKENGISFRAFGTNLAFQCEYF